MSIKRVFNHLMTSAISHSSRSIKNSLVLASVLVPLSLPAWAAEPVAFSEFVRFSNSGIRQPVQQLIQTQADFEAFWNQHAGSMQSVPQVDFSREWLIAVVLGEQPSVGYSACVDSIQRDQALLDVKLQVTAPPQDTFMARVNSSPGCLVRLAPQATTQIRFTYPEQQSQRTDLPMRTLSQSSNSLILQPRYVVAQDVESFRQLWLEHTGTADTMPMVDFSKEMVIAAFMGEQATGGYSLNIESVTEEQQRLRIKVGKVAPQPDQMVIQMLTAPAHLVAVPRRDLPIDFQ